MMKFVMRHANEMTIFDMPPTASHQAVQAIAQSVLAQLGPTLRATDTEASIAQRAARMLAEHGITETWYHDCPAFVLLGSRSCLSVSGAQYRPADEPVGATNLVTVDLSPLRDGIWGDCARSFFVEDGRCTTVPALPEFQRGAAAERHLHERMRSFATPQTSFEALFRFANDEIAALGFENLDFLGNVGHSIESARGARRFIEQGNAARLGDMALFTFEPHIRVRGGRWGFKHEDIYRFGDDGKPVAI